MRQTRRPMPKELEALLLTLLRSGRLGDRMAPLVHALLLAQLLAGSAHAGPPHASQRAPRHVAPRRTRTMLRGSVAGRRPRG